MPRPPLPVGTWGRIHRTETPEDSGRWRATARFRDFDGRTRQVEAWGPSPNKAEQALVAALRDRAMPAGDDIAPDMPLEQLGRLWLTEHARNVTPQTLERYEVVFERHIVPAVGGLRVREATTGRLDRFLKKAAEQTPGQARHCRVILAGMLGMAVRHDAITSNPVRDVAASPRSKRTVRALSVDELGVLRRAIGMWQDGLNPKTGQRERTTGRNRPTDLLDVVDLLAATGARIGEVLALRWDDVDLGAKRPTVTITGTLVYVKGQGLRRQEHPKTASGWRKVVLPRFAVETLLRRQVEEYPNPWNVVFPSASGSLRSPANFRRQWRAARADTGFEWVTPHVFRKTVATLLNREYDTDHAAAQLGHAGTAVTEKHYVQKVHEAPDMADVLEALGNRVRDA